MNCCVFYLCASNRSSGKNQTIYLWVRTTCILPYRWLIFFLEMPPYNGVYFIFTVERNDGRGEGKSVIDLTTPFELLFTHTLCLIRLCRNQPLNSILHPTATGVLYTSAKHTSLPPLTITFKSVITKVELAFMYLYVWNLVPYKGGQFQQKRGHANTSLGTTARPWVWP